MIINTSQVELVLTNKAIPAYSIEVETGVARNVISRIRRGESRVGNLTLKNVMKIQQWIDDGNFKVSYDYSELIEDLVEDIEKGLAKEYICIVRGEFEESVGICPIIAYFHVPEDIGDYDVAEKARPASVLAEMELFNHTSNSC